ncbi:3-oxoacyl-reductase [Exophiala viscosa]|uniref:3-oxoacyl-reductase n=1 Tax=Exophiala viscosa TaxID=2486360 RepID=A0AAN6IFG3_9EURO|nr:3-oxoacyl-reductase [Exophiala viscosa]KAI1624063.1 3-oxoacyl-reductase [Exophiala viscosa]
MPTAVVTGCNSGIGHAFAQLLIKEGFFVYAVDMTAGEKLKALHGDKCQIGRLDVTSLESIYEFKLSLGDKKIDLLLNVAGVMPPPQADSLRTVNQESLQSTFAVNTFGPLLLTQALLDNVLAAPSPRHIAVVSSRVGSIADNTSGGAYAYRSSKSAVNSIFKSLAVELKDQDVVVSMLHPGVTRTNLGGIVVNSPESVGADEAASKLWKVLKSKGLEDTGKFWHREGQELPW